MKYQELGVHLITVYVGAESPKNFREAALKSLYENIFGSPESGLIAYKAVEEEVESIKNSYAWIIQQNDFAGLYCELRDPKWVKEIPGYHDNITW